ncbi:MAG: hypothetical protein U0457_10035 [Candidatus Sericytochromatia bacterium]
MLAKLSSFTIIAFCLSFALGSICFFHILKTLLTKKVSLKFLSDSMGDYAKEKSTIILICTILGLFSMTFYTVAISIVIFFIYS